MIVIKWLKLLEAKQATYTLLKLHLLKLNIQVVFIFVVEAGPFYYIVYQKELDIFLNNRNTDIFFPEKYKCKWSLETLCPVAGANAYRWYHSTHEFSESVD